MSLAVPQSPEISPEISISQPVVVIGAGPIGLAAAAHLQARGLPHLVIEAGDTVAAGVRTWGHVRLFSPWSQLIDPAARRLLDDAGWSEPDPEAFPTGADWSRDYLEPLAKVLGDTVRLRTRVVGVARRGRDVMVDTDRQAQPFVVLVATPEGPARITAGAVIDASGTLSRPNPLGAEGLPAAGEAAHDRRITHGMPDMSLEVERERYAGRHTAVVGAGHSAMTSLLALARLSDTAPGTRITWVLRGDVEPRTYGGGDGDQLAQRGALGQAAAAAVGSGVVTPVGGFRTIAVGPDPESDAHRVVRLTAVDGREINGIDELVVNTGYRPDLAMLEELRLAIDPTTQAPAVLAPLIDPNHHSCGTVPPHGEADLRQPEAGFYLAGMKSYGRAPTFLALTGFEQVRSIVAAMAGDHEAAARVELILPETGVCNGPGLDDRSAGGSATTALTLVDGDGGCCGPTSC